ncbi:hypothetical protein Scep_001395 [Stephania cephalantha]|uniref:Uncharacterized protein n=1 Tax=Stephania cephalantha TaxID=152367 RepID=A0AAP0LBP0_9MAGN
MLGSFWRETKRFGILSKLALQISAAVRVDLDRGRSSLARLRDRLTFERYIAIEEKSSNDISTQKYEVDKDKDVDMKRKSIDKDSKMNKHPRGYSYIEESHLKRHPQEMEQGAGWLEKVTQPLGTALTWSIHASRVLIHVSLRDKDCSVVSGHAQAPGVLAGARSSPTGWGWPDHGSEGLALAWCPRHARGSSLLPCPCRP